MKDGKAPTLRVQLIEAKLLCQNKCFQKWITRKYILRVPF